MRILIYGILYAPELTGVGKYSGEMAAWMVRQGHTVDAIMPMPYYPEWKVQADYKNKGWFTEFVDGVRVHRCPIYVPKKVTASGRMLLDFSFLLNSLFYWIRVLFSKRYDAVICVAPPFHIGLFPVLYSMVRHVPVWLHIQDLQIDIAKEMGMIKSERFLNLLFKAERFILKRCKIVSTISEGMIRKVTEKNCTQSDCVLFPNWVDEGFVKPLPKHESLRAELGLTETDKVVLYSGSIGEKQGLELIIEAANQFAHRPDLKFLIFGSGGGKGRLEALVQQHKLTNVSFYPLQPYEKLSALLATADLHLVLQKKSASDLVLPSKLTGILAAGGCALVSAVPGTSLHKVVADEQMGILIEPDSLDALIEGIDRAFRSDLTVYRKNARAYARRNLSKEEILQQFEAQMLNELNPVAEQLVAEQV
ncbi:WcaI family glycosyltransferase [Spirosoma panaciterrae]|uniref:WcaI family glycosyltransferase n=1 Tax=Spirosoma panaciterrae TaxID=496058 RepID=UPI00037899C5|nr:WcaI family glycosyltransferase [Spirosoma panaciterrae]